MYNQIKKKLTKNLKYKTVDLSSDYNAGVELAKWCDHVKDHKRPIRVKTEKGWMTEDFLKYNLPEWQNIWIKKKVEIKWNNRQRSFFLTYLK